MTQKDLEKVFAGFKDVKGLPDTKMEFFIQDFKKYIEKLMQYDEVQITHLYLEEPELDIQTHFTGLEAYHEVQIDDEIKSLYNQANQLQLRWIHKKHPRFDKKKDGKFTFKPYDNSLIDDEMGKGRFINVISSDYFLKKWPGYYVDFKEDEGYELYYLNYDQHFAGQLAINMDREAKKLELYTGDDYFADVKKLDKDFATYMYEKININDEIVASASKE